MNEVTEEAYSVMLLEKLIEKLGLCRAAPLGVLVVAGPFKG